MAKEITETNYFTTKLYPKTEASMKVKSNAYQRYIASYIDKNNEILFATGPSKRLFFGAADRDIAFQAINSSEVEVAKVLKDSGALYDNAFIMGKPFNLGAAMIIRYYSLNKKYKELELPINLIVL